MTRTLFNSLIIILFASCVLADEEPLYNLRAVNNTKEAGALNYMIRDLYLGKASLLGNNKFSGSNTFTQPLVAQSSMTVYGSINTQGKHMEVIYYNELTEQKTGTIWDITGLDGSIDKSYDIEIIGISGGAGGIYMTDNYPNSSKQYSYVVTNNDGSSITPDYGSNIDAGIPVGSLYTAGYVSFSKGTYTQGYDKTTKLYNGMITLAVSGGAAYLKNVVGIHNSGNVNLTSIQIYTSGGVYMNAGSRITVWARR